jgi:hypothetical protein
LTPLREAGPAIPEGRPVTPRRRRRGGLLVPVVVLTIVALGTVAAFLLASQY